SDTDGGKQHPNTSGPPTAPARGGEQHPNTSVPPIAPAHAVSMSGVSLISLYQPHSIEYNRVRTVLDDIESGHDERVDAWIRTGAIRNGDDGGALCEAVTHGHMSIVKRLLEAGATTHRTNSHPMFKALQQKHIDIAQLLLEHGADIHADDNYLI